MYQPIDQIKTGIKLKMMLKAAGYEVRDIQEYLHLSCPQSIYRWYKGKILPSVEHLCALSKLLNVHMEELLVLQGQNVEDLFVLQRQHIEYDSAEVIDNARVVRLLSYVKRINGVA
ncbi:MAG: helix-turn-helix domain-containing protein [Lachnospiraceae bacterium]|nr:helix-turn-helix domain-containing protein [Lachnospiraceae bacterium]